MKTLVVEAEKYVISYLNENLNFKYVYHNLAHTQRVVSKVKELFEASELDESEKAILQVAAWFHDTGFTKMIEGHEKESVKIASIFLKTHNVNTNTIETITNIILATQMDYVPKTQLEGIIKDADCAHVSSKKYDEYASLLRKEIELTLNKTISKGFLVCFGVT